MRTKLLVYEQSSRHEIHSSLSYQSSYAYYVYSWYAGNTLIMLYMMCACFSDMQSVAIAWIRAFRWWPKYADAHSARSLCVECERKRQSIMCTRTNTFAWQWILRPRAFVAYAWLCKNPESSAFRPLFWRAIEKNTFCKEHFIRQANIRVLSVSTKTPCTKSAFKFHSLLCLLSLYRL